MMVGVSLSSEDLVDDADLLARDLLAPVEAVLVLYLKGEPDLDLLAGLLLDLDLEEPEEAEELLALGATRLLGGDGEPLLLLLGDRMRCLARSCRPRPRLGAAAAGAALGAATSGTLAAAALANLPSRPLGGISRTSEDNKSLKHKFNAAKTKSKKLELPYQKL